VWWKGSKGAGRENMQIFGKWLILVGGVAVLLGVLLLISDRIPFLGKLPGDISIKRENFQLYIPITTSLVLSLLVTALFWIISRYRGK
jgi:hypothetical protein